MRGIYTGLAFWYVMVLTAFAVLAVPTTGAGREKLKCISVFHG